VDALRLELLRSGAMTKRDIAATYGVNENTIGHISFGRTWSHLHQPPAPACGFATA
jgi:hypothetical protein